MSEIGETTVMVADLAMEETDRGKAVEMRPRWHEQVALSTLVMAMLAAVGALLAGIAVQEATMERMQEIIDFSILEGDRAEVEILKARLRWACQSVSRCLDGFRHFGQVGWFSKSLQ